MQEEPETADIGMEGVNLKSDCWVKGIDFGQLEVVLFSLTFEI